MEILGTKKHKIIYGDALEALKTLPDNSIDLIFADPPYNIGKNFNGNSKIIPALTALNPIKN